VARAETGPLATLHDDDGWHPDFLARVVRHMVHDRTIGMTFTDFWTMDADGKCPIEHTRRESRRTHRSIIPGAGSTTP
jgi:hypothetical protein